MDNTSQVTLATRIARFALNQPITVFMVFLALMVIGLVATSRLKQELIPSVFSNSDMSIHVNWRDAPAKEILDNITLPLEEELSTLKGLEQIRSATWVGGARVNLSFKASINPNVAYREVRDRIERARLLFPEDVQQPTIRKQDSSNIPTVVYGIIVDDGIDDYVGLVENGIIPTLERIDGVADVDIGAVQGKEVLIDINREALEAAGLNPLRVTRSLADDNFTLVAGQAQSGNKQYLLRSVSQFTTLDDIKNRLVASNIQLKDIANVQYKAQDTRWAITVNSKRALTLRVVKEGGANTVDVAQRVNQALDTLAQKPELQSLTFKKLFDQGEEIQSALKNLIDSGKYGALLAFLVLFFFLVKTRLTLVITASIPICLIVALTAMYFFGMTLNVFTLISLVICVGLLVDNAVVVAENITRLYQENRLTKQQACIKGCADVALAILMATLTTIVVFLPISLIEGETKALLQQFSIPLTFALIGSFLSAIIFIPLWVYLTLGSSTQASNSPRSYSGFYSRFYSRFYTGFCQKITHAQWCILQPLHRFYLFSLVKCLHNRKTLIAMLFVLMTGTGYVSKQFIDVELAQNNAQNTVDIRFRSPRGTTYEDNAAYFKQVDAILKQHKEALQIKDYMVWNTRSRGRLQAWFEEETLQQQSTADITKKIVALIPEKIGYRLRYGEDDESNKEKKSQISITLHGQNINQLERIGDTLAEKILKVDGVLGLQSVQDDIPNELALVIDREKAMASAVESSDIASTVGNALRGRVLSTMMIENNRTNVSIRYQESDREYLSDIDTFNVNNSNDEALSVGALTHTQFTQSAQYIARTNKKIAYRVSFALDPKKAKPAKTRVFTLRDNTDLPEGVSFNQEFEAANLKKINQVVFTSLLSVVLIYLLMGFLFESFLLPFSILLTLPLAALGVQAGFLITGLPIDMMSFVAIILLLGIVVNNGIVIIDTIIQLREQGLARQQAIEQAVAQRIKPVIMTAVTTIVGLIPLTFAPPSSMGITYTSFGTALISGLLASTLLTLLVVPVFYTVFDDASIKIARLLNRLGFYTHSR